MRDIKYADSEQRNNVKQYAILHEGSGENTSTNENKNGLFKPKTGLNSLPGQSGPLTGWDERDIVAKNDSSMISHAQIYEKNGGGEQEL